MFYHPTFHEKSHFLRISYQIDLLTYFQLTFVVVYVFLFSNSFFHSGVNFINFFWARFLYKFLAPSQTQLEKTTFVQKICTFNVDEIDGRCQFHQRFFVRKSFWQLFLVTFWQKKHFRTKNAHVKCWWNWPQTNFLTAWRSSIVRILPIFNTE